MPDVFKTLCQHIKRKIPHRLRLRCRRTHVCRKLKGARAALILRWCRSSNRARHHHAHPNSIPFSHEFYRTSAGARSSSPIHSKIRICHPLTLRRHARAVSQNSRYIASTVTHCAIAFRFASRAGSNRQIRTFSIARSSNPNPKPFTILTCAARPSAVTNTRSVTLPCSFACRASSVYSGSGQYTHFTGYAPGEYFPLIDSPSSSPSPDPTESPAFVPMVFPPSLPFELVLSFIHGKPRSRTCVGAGAFASKIVGSTGNSGFCSVGKCGRNKTIGEC